MHRTAVVWSSVVLVIGLSGGLAVADAQNDFDTLFGAEARQVAATASTADDAAFAAKLLTGGKSLGESPALQALVYEKAYEFGIKQRNGYAKALEALDLWGKIAPDRADDLQAKKLDLLQRQYASSSGDDRKAAAKQYLEQLLVVADATAEKDPVEANKLYNKAYPIARYVQSPLVSDIIEKRKVLVSRLAAARKREVKVKALQTRVKSNPKDVKARTDLILLYLLEDDDPAEAAKWLSPDLDEALRTYLPLAAKPLVDLPEAGCMELGAWYEQLATTATAERKATALRRAAACYKQFLATHTTADAAGLKAKMSLAAVTKAPAELRAAAVPKGPLPPKLTLTLAEGVSMQLVLIPAGTFTIGSPKSEYGRRPNEGPQHWVRISRPYYMGIYEVTQEQYKAVTGENPSKQKGAENPVEQVSWQDAVAFCKKLTQKTGRTVRLPTDAEWEYACRAGTKTRFSFGNTVEDLGDYAWFKDNSGRRTQPVGKKKPNRAGLYDMHGNVWEWCWDWYDGKPYPTATGVTDPTGPRSGQTHVIRGGGAQGCVANCLRSAFRIGFVPPIPPHIICGFRVVVAR